MQELVQVAIAEGTMTITLDSPRNRNALSRDLRAQLIDALTRAADRDDVRVVILTHTGPVFCAGMDLKETVAERAGEEGVREFPQILRLIAHCPKPVIGRVNGPARGGGVGLVAACDISVAVDTATFALPEARVGLIPSTVSVPVLAKVHATVARAMMLTGLPLSAERARDAGLVTAVSAAGDLDDSVADYRDAVLMGGPTALAGTKELLAPLLGDDEERYDEMLELSARQFATDEAREGATAFAEKRRAIWMPPAS